MNAWAMLTATAMLGVDVGWQPLDNGGFEYIIQIPPHQVQSLEDGQDITAGLPPLLRGVRNYRITVGDKTLPRVGVPPPVTGQPADVTNNDPAAPSTDGTSPPVLPGKLDQVEVANANRITETDGQRATGYASRANHNHADDNHSDDQETNQTPSGDALATDANHDKEEVSSVPDAFGGGAVGIVPPTRPWWPLTLTLMGLFGSVGLNGYLGWIFFELRGRHRQLVVSRIQDAAFDVS